MFLRLFLLLIAAVYLLFGGLLMFDVSFFSTLYNLVDGETLSYYLASRTGVLFISLGLGALFAIWKPSHQRGIIIMLLLASFLLFVGDIVAITKGYVNLGAVIPEMLFLILNWVVLIRWFPQDEKKVAVLKANIEPVRQIDVINEQEKSVLIANKPSSQTNV